MDFLQIFIDNGGIIGIIIGMVITSILIPLFLKYLPSSKFDAWGEKIGLKIDEAGKSAKYIGNVYDEIERTILGTIVAFVNGLKRGLTKND